VRLKFGEREVQTLPEEAIMTGMTPQVFRVEQDTVRVTNVRLGRRQGQRVEVEGLNPGDVVVTAGQMKLQDGVRVVQREAPTPQSGVDDVSPRAPTASPLL